MSLTLLKKDPTTTVNVSVTANQQAAVDQVKSFVSAFNDILTFAKDQSAAASKGETNNIGRDALLRGLRNELRGEMNREYATGGTYTYLSQVGLGFDRSGKLTLDEKKFAEATKNGNGEVMKLFAGANGIDGAFTKLQSLVTGYTEAGGLVPDAKTRITAQLQSVADPDLVDGSAAGDSPHGAEQGVHRHRSGDVAPSTSRWRRCPPSAVSTVSSRIASTQMQAYPARAAQAYLQTHVQSRSPLELVVMLYDGLLRFLGDAGAAIDGGDLAGQARRDLQGAGGAVGAAEHVEHGPGRRGRHLARRALHLCERPAARRQHAERSRAARRERAAAAHVARGVGRDRHARSRAGAGRGAPGERVHRRTRWRRPSRPTPPVWMPSSTCSATSKSLSTRQREATSSGDVEALNPLLG